MLLFRISELALILLIGCGAAHSAAAGAEARTAAGDGDHHWDQNLETSSINIMSITFTLRTNYPFEDEDDEGSHHGGVLTEVQLLRVALVFLEVACPVSPGPEHHDRAPDEHGEVHDAHHAGGEAVDGHANLLPAVDLSVTLSTLLVHLGPAIDCCNNITVDKEYFGIRRFIISLTV